MPVLLVPGNRDYYRSSIVEGRQEAVSKSAEYPDVYLMDRAIVKLGGLRFIGTTLWGDTHLNMSTQLSLYFARKALEDSMNIRTSKRPSRRFSSAHAETMCHEDGEFLREALGQAGVEPTVVVTHHAPSTLSIMPTLLGNAKLGERSTHLETAIVQHKPAIWIHGNLPHRSDYRIEATRIVCNPRGCRLHPVPDFDARLVIDLDRTEPAEHAQQ